MTTDERSGLSNLAAALKPFRELSRSIVGAMPVSIVQTFLLVAMKEDCTVTELAQAAGVSTGTMSRQLADLSSVNRYGEVGLGLIEQHVQIYDRRHTKNRLSVKGRAFAHRIAGAMEQPMKEAA